MQNLLDAYRKKVGKFWDRLSRPKKILLISAIVLVVLVLFLSIWAVINIRNMKDVYRESLAGKKSFEYAQVAIGTQNFVLAKKDLTEAHDHFTNAQESFQRFSVYKIVPFLSRQIKAVDSVLAAGVNLSSGLVKLSDLGIRVTDVLKEKEGDIKFSDISLEEKREVLKALSESTADLRGVKADIELAALAIESIPDDGLLRVVREAVQPVKQELPVIETIINQALPAAEALPSILGYPNEKTYLFLLQNNRELRPTGGFIGTYGILKVDAGEITTFQTDNIYNLDNAAKDRITEPSPGPIAQHTTTQNWLMRNANWSPDFPTSARKAEEKYHEEGGPEQQVDGVIAVTPTFIESLLTLTGPITVESIEFTQENLFANLEHEVRFGYLQEGISESERKEIIGTLGKQLLDEILGLPRSQFSELWKTFLKNVNEKQILIYVDDPITQELVVEQNWAGEVKPYSEDFLLFIDANLAALKTDNVMKRELSYTVAEENGSYIGTANMHYIHTYPHIDGSHTRYRTYTRIYLPKGATLLEHAGFLTGDKIQGGVPADPEVSEESFTNADGTTSTYTVIGGFTAIEPGEEGDIRVTYRLPETVAQAIKENRYNLYIQKQAGTVDHGLRFSFDIGKKIENASPSDLPFEIQEGSVSLNADLTVDRDISIEFK